MWRDMEFPLTGVRGGTGLRRMAFWPLGDYLGKAMTIAHRRGKRVYLVPRVRAWAVLFRLQIWGSAVTSI